MLSHRWSRLTSPVGRLILSATLFLVLLSLTEATNSSQSIFPKRRETRVKREGEWSPWSVWSSCSRSCGTGIRTQSRQCQLRKGKSKSTEVTDVSRFRNVSSRHCDGHDTRAHVCNTQDCPDGTIDFRRSQCEAFNNRMFIGKMYKWDSFIDDRSPCSLTCRASGFRFFTTLAKRVADGTNCNSVTTNLDTHVCVAGNCIPIGCDGIAGSNRQNDICGVCGGDNSTCRFNKISGIYSPPHLSLGYNKVHSIPKEARFIQVSTTKAAIALRKMDGPFVFNGQTSGVFEAVGTRFKYIKNDVQTLLESHGPLQEPVELLLVYQKPNPGIKYQYFLPILGDSVVPPSPLTVQDRHPTIALDTPSRPASFRSGAQHHLKSLGSYPMSEQAPTRHFHHRNHHKGHHGRGHKRDSAAASSHDNNNNNGKKFYWKIIGHTNCSEPCGGGVSTSITRCVKGPLENVVSDRRCTQEKPPGQSIRCNLRPCPAEWVIGEWSDCSAKECGEGFKTRPIHCQQRISPTLTMSVAEAACLQRKPRTREICQIRSCRNWDASEWSECSSKCGNGVRKRSVSCVDSSKQEKIIMGSEECDQATKPAEVTSCNMTPCNIQADWFYTNWSNCSAKCGNGVQTRNVVCSGISKFRNETSSTESKELESNMIDDDDNIKSNSMKAAKVIETESSLCEKERPPVDRECYSDRTCGEGSWFASAWGDCSASCGSGVKTRQVLCVIFSRGKFKVVDDFLCAYDKKPTEKEQCESNKSCPSSRWFTTDWSECSAICGGGTQKRSVSCRDSSGVVISAYCSDKDRPLDRRSCNEHKCSLSLTTAMSSSPSFTSKNSDEMLKDKPIGGAPTGPTVPSQALFSARNDSSSTNSSSSSSNADGNSTTTNNHGPATTVTHEETHESKDGQDIHDQKDDPDEPRCTDQYHRCGLVVQAGLCRYKYYSTVCELSCSSCSKSL